MADTEQRHTDAATRLERAVIGALGHRFTSGNEVTVLKNGVQIFPAMLEAIRTSRRSIEFVTFVYWTGDIAETFAEALAERAEAGLTVRVILDGFGSQPMSVDLVDRMRGAGVQVERFRPPIRWKAWEADHRTHRKILVCDDTVGFTGGVGIASEWEGDARDETEWRDTHFRIVGPAVLGLKSSFLTDWRDSERRMSPSDLEPAEPPTQGSSRIAVVNASAQIGYNDAERVLEALIGAARSQIRIQTPYFNPTEVVVDTMEEALRRGVDLELMVPGPHIDKRISRVMAEAVFRPLLDKGLKVFEYQTSMLHTKALTVDGVVAMVGSVNINRRSVEKDEEAALIVLDEAVVEILDRHFEEDRESCEPVTIDDAGPGIVKKAAETMLRPIEHEM